MANKTTTAKRKSTASSTGKKSTATKKQSSTKKNTTKSTGAKTKTKNVTVEAEVIDVAKVEAIKEVFLWLFLAVCVLLFLSNLGIGGVVGNAVSGFFFGILGLIAYFFPILFLIATFFGISNHGNHVATILHSSIFIKSTCIYAKISHTCNDTFSNHFSNFWCFHIFIFVIINCW